jgi:hypothetical protein
MPLRNLTIESPDFNRIRKGDSFAVEDAIRLLWLVANEEARARRSGDRVLENRLSPKVLSKAPTGNENNVDTEDAGLIVYTHTVAANITGYRAPSQDGEILFILVTGSATITHMHQDGSSDAGNRMVFQSGADVGVTTNKALVLIYQNARWREMKLV